MRITFLNIDALGCRQVSACTNPVLQKGVNLRTRRKCRAASLPGPGLERPSRCARRIAFVSVCSMRLVDELFFPRNARRRCAGSLSGEPCLPLLRTEAMPVQGADTEPMVQAMLLEHSSFRAAYSLRALSRY
jgi:hypothetical protein